MNRFNLKLRTNKDDDATKPFNTILGEIGNSLPILLLTDSFVDNLKITNEVSYRDKPTIKLHDIEEHNDLNDNELVFFADVSNAISGRFIIYYHKAKQKFINVPAAASLEDNIFTNQVFTISTKAMPGRIDINATNGITTPNDETKVIAAPTDVVTSDNSEIVTILVPVLKVDNLLVYHERFTDSGQSTNCGFTGEALPMLKIKASDFGLDAMPIPLTTLYMTSHDVCRAKGIGDTDVSDAYIYIPLV